MKIVSGACAVCLALLAVALGFGADRADAATTEIGAVSEIESAAPPSEITAGGFAIQIAEAAGSYVVPPGYGTISAWRHSTGGVTGTLTFKVYRPTGVKQEFLVVGSDAQIVTAGTVATFPVQIPVRPGDRIGLSSDDVQLAYESNDAADRIGFFGADPAPGSTRVSDGDPFPDFKLDVAATLESDPAAGPGGTPVGGSPGAVASLPRVSGLSVAPRAFRAARRGPSAQAAGSPSFGTRVRYALNVAATVRFVVVRRAGHGRRQGSGDSVRCVVQTTLNRNAARCTRSIPLPGSFVRMSAAGASSFRFSGRIAGRTLKPGAYALVATASAGAKTGRSVSHSFRITR